MMDDKDLHEAYQKHPDHPLYRVSRDENVQVVLGLRDRCAIAALQGMMPTLKAITKEQLIIDVFPKAAELSYAMADAMLKARQEAKHD